MKVLFVGGTGEISLPCVEQACQDGHEVTVFNRGNTSETLPAGVAVIVGDLGDERAYAALADQRYDVVCQFVAFDLADVQRDAAAFGGQCDQYVFISTASAYEKPPRGYVLTEDVPLKNPFWEYSQKKADMEAYLMEKHRQRRLNVTVVRPSHTVRRNFPGGIVRGDDWAWRMKNNRPVLIHGDGSALWTLTHASDFARPFVKLLGNRRAYGQAFHITRHLQGFTWNAIFEAMAAALDATPDFVHVPSDVLVRYNPQWSGPLFGDKFHAALFDNSKVMQAAGPFNCETDLSQMMRSAADHYRQRAASYCPDPQLHNLLDTIATDMNSIGRH